MNLDIKITSSRDIQVLMAYFDYEGEKYRIGPVYWKGEKSMQEVRPAIEALARKMIADHDLYSAATGVPI